MRSSEFLIEMYIAFELSKKDRRRLAELFPPKYPEFVGHHITYNPGVKKNTPIPKGDRTFEVVGYADDGESIEALIVAVNGSTTRPDGKIYHITWSLDREKGRTPVHSNNLIHSSGYKEVPPISITATAKLF